MQSMMAAYYPNNVTTDHIQQYLDENKSLILKIVESQNSGKLNECAENQARFQRNLMYLAAIADSQPQPPTLHSQYPTGGIMQPGVHYGHHQQAQPMTTPQSIMAARSSLLYGQQQYPSLLPQALNSQLGMSPGGSSGLMLQLQGHEPHASSTASGAFGGGAFPDYSRSTSGDGLQSGTRRLGGETHQDARGETGLYMKGSNDRN
uniref:Protein ANGUSTIFOLIA 3 n=1 Tax=Monophyllaea glabra TaxID=1873335 RepID=A0A6F8Z4P7_9LAMI|nr:protein ANGUSTIFOLIA 3 [Monophyllaea glabra]